MANKQRTARAGKTIDRYVIERELGRGGMGVVYLAVDQNLGRRVALKTTSIASIGSSDMARGQRQARFNREVKALTQVNHENVVHVFDSGEADDPELGWVLYYTMQFVDGITLAQLVHRKGGLDPGAAAAVCRQVAAGLGAGHKVGIVHRDVKPANIFINNHGRALIGDFGICKLAGSTQITRRDQLVGTPNYLAPEQILGDEITPATDVFALGALFFVITTNRPLRDRVDPASLLAEAQTNDPKKKMQALKEVPDGLRKVVARALEQQPKKRWKDCTAFAEALAEFETRIPAFDQPGQAGKTQRKKAPDTSTSPFAPLPALDADTPLEDPVSASSAAASDTADQAPAGKQAPTGEKPAPFDFAGSGAAGVEEAAQALLKDAGIRDEKATKKKNKRKKKKENEAKLEDLPSRGPALPVARAESTVMYNLRKAEADEQGPSAAVAARASRDDDEANAPLLEPRGQTAGELPVARAESTVMYNMRKAEADHRGQASGEGGAETTGTNRFQSSSQVGEPARAATGLAPAQINPALAEPTDAFSYEKTPEPGRVETPAVQPPVVQPKVKRVDAAAVQKNKRAPMQIPPAAIMAAVGLGGALLAVILLVILNALLGSSDARPEDAPVASKTLASTQAPSSDADEIPRLCREKRPPAAIRKKAEALADEAHEAFQAGDQKEALVMAKRALERDSRNLRAHFLRARLMEAAGKPEAAKASYACVVYIDLSSDEAEAAKKALKKLGD